MRSAIIVDSSATINKELANHPDIYQVYLTINFPNGDTYRDSNDEASTKEFYELLAENDEIPSTSQPEPKEYIKIYEHLIEEGYDNVYVIVLSSEISGTYQTARLAAKEFEDDIQSYLIDSKATSFIVEDMVEQALAMIDKELAPEVIFEKLNWVADHQIIYASLEDLSHIKKSGRLGSTTAMLGNFLRIKPVIYFREDGSVGIYEKVRTTKRVYKLYLEIVRELVGKTDYDLKIVFAHGDCEEDILEVKEMIEEEFPDLTYRVGYLTGVLGVHGGPGTKGMGIVAQAPLDE